MKDLVSPKQAARAIGASESSLKRWCDSGLLPVVRTAGGHRRIAVEGVLRFIREQGRELVDPEVIGLPPLTGRTDRTLCKGRDALLMTLLAGQCEATCRIVLDLYVEGRPLASIFDQIARPALEEIGEMWARGHVQVYEERRAVELLTQALFELDRVLPPAGALGGDAQLAFGGTFCGDPYSLAARMASVTLREAGFRSVLLGCGLPAETFETAIQAERPRLVWVSISQADGADLADRVMRLSSACGEVGAELVLGGRALTNDVRRMLPPHHYCGSMTALVELVEEMSS